MRLLFGSVEEAFSAKGHHGSLDDLLTCLFSTLQPGVKGGHVGVLAPLIGYMDYLPLPDDVVVCATFCLCELNFSFSETFWPTLLLLLLLLLLFVKHLGMRFIHLLKNNFLRSVKAKAFWWLINFVSAVVVIDILFAFDWCRNSWFWCAACCCFQVSISNTLTEYESADFADMVSSSLFPYCVNPLLC